MIGKPKCVVRLYRCQIAQNDACVRKCVRYVLAAFQHSFNIPISYQNKTKSCFVCVSGVYEKRQCARKESMKLLACSFLFRKNRKARAFNSTKFVEERKAILKRFSKVKKPHAVIMEAFDQLLDKIQVSYKIDRHGVKEYSGIDICKDLKRTTIGFQIKSRNDDISEPMIRFEASKARARYFWRCSSSVDHQRQRLNEKILR